MRFRVYCRYLEFSVGLVDGAFQAFKKKLVSHLGLRAPATERAYRLCTDASGFDLGAPLMQLLADGDHPGFVYQQATE